MTSLIGYSAIENLILTCEDGAMPGWTTGSRRWIVNVEHGKRRPAWTSAISLATIKSGFILEVNLV